MKAYFSLRSADFIWFGVVLFFILAIAFLLPIQPNDFWWYLRLGEDIIKSGTVPNVDAFSSTQFGQPISYHSWLSAVFFFWIYHTGGTSLMVLLRGVIVASFYLLIWYTCSLAGANGRLASLITLIAALAGSNNWADRPQLFSLPLFAFTLLCLWQWRLGRGKWVLAIPVTMLFWVNLHGSFILGFLLVGAALAGGEGNKRDLLAAFGLMGAISLINPRGWGAWAYVYSLLSDPASQQLGAEWHPPSTEVWQGIIFFVWFLIFPMLVSLSKRTLSWMDWFLFLGFGWMALSGLRYVIWFIAILAVLSASLLEPLIGRYLDPQKHHEKLTLNRLIVSFLMLLPLLFLPEIRERWWEESPPVLTANTPVEAVEWIKAHPQLPGPLWSDLAFSSYLIYSLPERPVWIDTRFELYPVTQWEKYIDVSKASSNWSAILDEEEIALILADSYVQEPLIDSLDRSADWCLLFFDQTSKLYTRNYEGGDCNYP
jgi:hypothetical protein